ATLLVGAQHVLERVGVRGGGHVVDVEGLDVASVVEHLGELVGERAELVVGQLEPRQPRHVRDVVAGDLRHAGNATPTWAAALPSDQPAVTRRANSTARSLMRSLS